VLNHPFIEDLKTQLSQPLPGIEAQFEMAHVNREKIRYDELTTLNYKSSAVLLLLIKRGQEFFIPLTERHTYIGAHSGQISLPGGKKEDTDADLTQTALRECHEEIGIIENIHLIGALTPVYIPVSKFRVNPYVAVFDGEEPEYKINVDEVKSLLELNINDLKDPALVKETYIEPAPGLKIKTPYFDVQGHIVWGATAMILNEFKKLL
jgi:8-oxo-dGTP pyrophosphatase MutT (NUDIX family)